jgi:hypothetical protein
MMNYVPENIFLSHIFFYYWINKLYDSGEKLESILEEMKSVGYIEGTINKEIRITASGKNKV